METTNDVLCFVNEFDFIDLKNDLIEKFRLIKRRLVIQFKDYNVSRLVSVLNIRYDMNISILTNKLEDFAEKMTPHGKIIYF